MRFLLPAILALALLAPISATPTRAANCQFVLGFKVFHDLIPQIVGECLTDEHPDQLNEGSVQETTGTRADGGYGGLLVWRKADNHTAFTDGFRTWVNGPFGLEERLNTERFQWEVVQQLSNAEYRLPLYTGREVTIRLVNGEYIQPPSDPLAASLLRDFATSGDLNGDGNPDAVALLSVNTGGSGIFVYLVAFLDQNGVLAQVKQEFLGDRVRPRNVSIADNGTITVEMIAHGPNEPLCCPTQQVTKTFSVK